MPRDRWTIGLGCLFAVLGVVTLAVWIPNDIESGVIETFRRQTSIGDAMAPTMVAAGILIVSVLMAVTEFLPRAGEAGPATVLDRQSARFLLRLFAILIVGLVLMGYVGPLTVDAINALGFDVGSYRQLRDTVPYKYLGYTVGGFVIIFGLIRLVENRLSGGAALAALVAVAILIFLYDVPFDDLLLPPNGDF